MEGPLWLETLSLGLWYLGNTRRVDGRMMGRCWLVMTNLKLSQSSATSVTWSMLGAATSWLRSRLWSRCKCACIKFCLQLPPLTIQDLSWVCNRKMNFLFINQNICCGCAKEPSRRDGSFEQSKHMLKIMGRKIFTILRWNFLFI